MTFIFFRGVETTNQHVSICGFSKSTRLASMSKPGKDGKGVDDGASSTTGGAGPTRQLQHFTSLATRALELGMAQVGHLAR